MHKPRLIFLALFFAAETQILQAQVPVPENNFATSSFFMEGAYGRGMVNNHYTQNAVLLNAGYRQFVATARFCRSGVFPAHYIFENAFLAGYRFDLAKQFRLTFSAGYSDLAFEKAGNHQEGNYTPSLFTKSNGLSFETEAEWMIPFHGKPSAWSVTAMYYSTFNGQQNLNGFTAGLKISPQRFKANAFQSHPDSVEVEEVAAGEEKSPREQKHAARAELIGSGKVPFTNSIRFNFTSPLRHESRIEYIHNYSALHSFTISAAWYLGGSLLRNVYIPDPDNFLFGPAAYGSWDSHFIFKHSYVSVDLGAGYRSLRNKNFYFGQQGFETPSWGLSRSRQDILMSAKLALYFPSLHSRSVYGFYMRFGLRNSEYHTTIRSEDDNPDGILPSNHMNGNYWSADLDAGFELSFGW